MKLAIITDTFLPQINGVTKTLSKMKEYMDKNGITYRFFVPRVKTDKEPLQNIISFDSISFILYPECKIALPNYIQIKKALDEFQPDLIHITTPFSLGLMGLKYGRDHNIKLVSSYHTDFPAYLKHYNLQFLEKALWKYLKWFHSFSHINFTPSQDTLEQLQENGIDNLDIWGRGIDTSKFTPRLRDERIRKQYGIGSEPLLFYVGRLAPEKELDVLMKAAKALNKNKILFKLILIGDGPAKVQLESYKIPNIIFAGYKSGEELYRHYASGDLFVFPSSSETYGNVILEAMSSGVPVIAPYAGGVKENLIHNYNGMAFQPGDGEDMAKTIQTILENPLRLGQLGHNARQHALGRSWDAVFEHLFNKYEDVIRIYEQKTESLSA